MHLPFVTDHVYDELWKFIFIIRFTYSYMLYNISYYLFKHLDSSIKLRKYNLTVICHINHINEKSL